MSSATLIEQERNSQLDRGITQFIISIMVERSEREKNTQFIPANEEYISSQSVTSRIGSPIRPVSAQDRKTKPFPISMPTFKTEKQTDLIFSRAIYQLAQAVIESEYEDYLLPINKETIETAREVLHKAYSMFPYHYEIYPVDNGGISIETPMGLGASIWFICDANGGIECRLNITGRPYKKDNLSDIFKFRESQFVSDALKELSDYLA